MVTRVGKPRPGAVIAARKPKPENEPARATVRALQVDELSTGQTRSLRLRALGGRASVRPASPRLDGGRTRGDALNELRGLLEGKPVSRDSGHGSTVVRDAPNVNGPEYTDPSSPEFEKALGQVIANAALEAAALAKLPAGAREQYLEVKQALEGNPMAQLSLQRLLFEGKLPGEEDFAGEGRLLDHLGALASGEAPLVDGIDGELLLARLVSELATPTAINQGPRNTCGPTIVLIELAMTNPAEYARLTLGLASPSGEVTTQSGLVLQREPGTESDDGSGRSLTQLLLAPAMMEATKASDYDNATDEGWGANAAQLDRLREAVLGSARVSHQKGLEGDPARRKLEVDMLANAVEEGDVPVAVLFDLGGGAGLHWVLVTDSEVRAGVEYFRVVNPWGQEELISRAELEQRIRGQVVEGSCAA